MAICRTGGCLPARREDGEKLALEIGMELWPETTLRMAGTVGANLRCNSATARPDCLLPKVNAGIGPRQKE